MELFAVICVGYLAWLLAARVLRQILGALRLLTWLLTAPLLWLARLGALRSLRRLQRARTMRNLRQLAE